LIEMRPLKSTPAHHTGEFGELVCSNSFGALSPDRAAGLLQKELRIFKSLIIQTADKFAVPAGGALAVDRSKFSIALTATLSNHPLIEIKRFEQLDLPSEENITILATGPLTADNLSYKIQDFTGIDDCHFFDAASPIIYGDSINKEIVFKASRYDKGDPAYLNCPMNKNDYIYFRNELIEGEQANLKDFENLNDFKFFIYGGFSSSQRSRIACFRGDNIPEEDALKNNFPAQGIKINGNFLFDNATQDDFRSLLIENGVNQIKVGDIWTIGDRGAQGIIDNSDIKHLDEKIFYLRDVKVKVNVVGIDELQIPSGRSKKLVNTVEASTRLDAIASAGFRISRTKIIERIENGMLKLNGSKVNKPTINLKIGDKLELENKGFIEIINLEITKRERWKVKLLRK